MQLTVFGILRGALRVRVTNLIGRIWLFFSALFPPFVRFHGSFRDLYFEHVREEKGKENHNDLPNLAEMSLNTEPPSGFMYSHQWSGKRV